MLKEFKDFAMRGNVLDLAVGIVIGAAFGGVVTSFVGDILMPPIGMLAGGLDFKDLFIPLDGGAYRSLEEVKTAGAPVLAYGNFINTIVNFLIVSFAIFLLIKQVNRFRPAPAPPQAMKECRFCRSSIPAAAIRCAQCTSDVTTS